MRGLQTALREAGYVAPGIERVAGSYPSQVKYFRGADSEKAKEIASISNRYFEGCKPPNAVAPVLEPATKPPPQIEVWISLNCGDN
jgi:hypothetical protein